MSLDLYLAQQVEEEYGDGPQECVYGCEGCMRCVEPSGDEDLWED